VIAFEIPSNTRGSSQSNRYQQVESRLVRLGIEKAIYGGDGLARLPPNEGGPGKSVFVPFVLPGEQVEAAILEEKRGFARARLEAIVEPSRLRVRPPCPYFQRCGGCHYQHTGYENQLVLKADILRETLRRTTKIELACELQVHLSPEWNYRNRTRLKVQWKPQFALGYYRHHSHDLLPVEECPISSPLINRGIRTLWAQGSTGSMPEAVKEVELFADDSDSSLLLEVYCGHSTSSKDAEQICNDLSAILAELHGVTVFEQQRPDQRSEPVKLASWGAESIFYKADGTGYRVSAGSFFQVNRFLIDELVKTVTEGASGELALDLYAGVGLLSVALARSFSQVIAVEASQTSYDDLRHNATPEVKALHVTTERFLAKATGHRPDLVVVDPPRAGLGENVVRGLARLEAPRVIYVSCDPSTLARDLRGLVGCGYKIEQPHLLDLFPQTFHIESVFHLQLSR
jgi:23S rRNA (uracil1939-C5)-methyltransferase